MRHASGQTSVGTAAQAAAMPEPVAGKATKLLFSLGVMGGGFLSVQRSWPRSASSLPWRCDPPYVLDQDKGVLSDYRNNYSPRLKKWDTRGIREWFTTPASLGTAPGKHGRH